MIEILVPDHLWEMIGNDYSIDDEEDIDEDMKELLEQGFTEKVAMVDTSDIKCYRYLGGEYGTLVVDSHNCIGPGYRIMIRNIPETYDYIIRTNKHGAFVLFAVFDNKDDAILFKLSI